MLRTLQHGFERLSFRQKIVLLPTLAAITIAFVLVVDAVMGVDNERQLEHLQHGHYPSLQLHHHLTDVLASSQRSLQDAVAASDLDYLEAADSLGASFHSAILSAPSIGEQERRQFADLDREFSAYYRMARRTSERMIRGDVTDEIIALQDTMRVRYTALRDHLIANTARDSAAVENAFLDSRASGRVTWVSSAILMGLCVLVLVALSRYTAGSLLRAITGAVRVADRLAEGDMSTTIPPASDDEVGQLLRSMRRMTENLSRVIGDLRASEADNRNLAVQLASARERLAHLLSSSPAVIYSRDLGNDRRITYISSNVESRFGYEPTRWTTESDFWRGIVHGDDVGDVLSALEGLAEREHCIQEYRLCHADGTHRWVRDELRLARDGEGSPVEYVGYLVDITQRKELEAQLTHLAYHDALTGLANRALFRDRVEHALVRAGRTNGSVGVLFLDLDDFKTVNDSLGHAEGDRLLVATASRLLNATRGCDTVARFGGDEFAILLEDVHHDADAITVAERITAAMQRPITVAGKEVRVGTSIGIARCSSQDSADELLRNADLAMYMAKKSGKGRWRLFEPAMHEAARDRLELEADLRIALDRQELVFFYQPVVELETGRIVGAEALLRWRHPERGLVPPLSFIGIAEQTDLIVSIGRWGLRAACEQVRAWDAIPGRAGEEPLTVMVNLSPRQLQQAGFADYVRDVLEATKLHPSRLVLEITENAVMQQSEATLRTLLALKAIGVQLGMDDFGTGYSSLSYLQRFPIDALKIDRSFVRGLGENRNDEALVRTVIALGGTLSLRTVAEGVETEQQRQVLTSLGCRLGQGFLFAKPMEASALAALLASPAITSATSRVGQE